MQMQRKYSSNTATHKILHTFLQAKNTDYIMSGYSFPIPPFVSRESN